MVYHGTPRPQPDARAMCHLAVARAYGVSTYDITPLRKEFDRTMDPRTSRPARARPAPRLQGWIGDLLWYSGLTALARWRQHRRPSARILAYHHILVPGDAARTRLPWTMYTDADAFARQMRYVARHYRPLALPALVDCLAHGDTVPPGSVAVTLDDGYHDQLMHALPALWTIGLPATVALVARDGGAPEDDWGAGERFATAPQWQAACTSATTVTLAGHSTTHRDLTACDADALRAELAGSRRHIRALGDTGDLFCYPGGMHNAAVRAATAAAGYRAAISCAPGANGRRTDPFALRRVLVGASADHFVAAQLAGLFDGPAGLFDGPAWLYHGLNRLRIPWRRLGAGLHRRPTQDRARGRLEACRPMGAGRQTEALKDSTLESLGPRDTHVV